MQQQAMSMMMPGMMMPGMMMPGMMPGMMMPGMMQAPFFFIAEGLDFFECLLEAGRMQHPPPPPPPPPAQALLSLCNVLVTSSGFESVTITFIYIYICFVVCSMFLPHFFLLEASTVAAEPPQALVSFESNNVDVLAHVFLLIFRMIDY